MKNKLCCVLNTFIICEGCKGRWCGPCWSDCPANSKDFLRAQWGPNKYAGHISIYGSGPFKCGKKDVSSDYADKVRFPITLEIVSVAPNEL